MSSSQEGGREDLPFFLQKLWQMVDDESTNDLVKWSDAGDSFVVITPDRFAHDLLPRYFKHRNFTSFVRQLNMYGFRKIVPTDSGLAVNRAEVEFVNPHFKRDQRILMENIKRKQSGQKNAIVSAPHVTPEDISQVVSTLRELKSRQDQVAMSLKNLSDDNKGLWSEVINLRQQVQRQDVMIKKLFQFITQFVSPIKRNRLAITDGVEAIVEPPAKIADVQPYSDSTDLFDPTSLSSSVATSLASAHASAQPYTVQSDSGPSVELPPSASSVSSVGEVYTASSTADTSNRGSQAVAMPFPYQQVFSGSANPLAEPTSSLSGTATPSIHHLAQSDSGASVELLSSTGSVTTVGEVHSASLTADNSSRGNQAVVMPYSYPQAVISEPSNGGQAMAGTSAQSPFSTSSPASAAPSVPDISPGVVAADSPGLVIATGDAEGGKSVQTSSLLPPQPDCKPECPETCGQHLESVQKGLDTVQQFLNDNVIADSSSLDWFNYSPGNPEHDPLFGYVGAPDQGQDLFSQHTTDDSTDTTH